MSDSEWGKGSRNNNIGWGQGANNAINWGKIHSLSNAGQTDIVGITSVNISYASSGFCKDANDPTPTVVNNVGAGVFSSTSGLVFVSASTGEIDISASTVGSYVITYTDTDGETATDTISINALPTIVISASNSSICNGESTTLTASGGSSYVWSNGENTPAITVSPTSTTTFTVTGTDSNGCTNTASQLITVNALPTVEISGTLTYCAGATTTLTATAGLSSYLWSTGETTQSINVTAGSYTVTGTDSNGCTATSSPAIVTEIPSDTASVTYSASAYCQMPTGALAVDGYYPLYATATEANAQSNDGASHAHTLNGTTYYMPGQDSYSTPGVVLYHGTYSLTTPAPQVEGESTGTFSGPAGLSIDSSTGVINVNNSTAGTHNVVYTTRGTCSITVTTPITINPLDGATFAYSASSLPQTGTASLTTTPTTSGGQYSAYPNTLSINSSTGEIDLANSPINSYKIFYITSGTCPNSSTFDLAVTAAGVANNFSMEFDGTNYINVDYNSLNFNSGMSISAWFKWDGATIGTSDNSRCIISRWSANSHFGTLGKQFILRLTNSTPNIQLLISENGTSNTIYTGSTTISSGIWYHVAVTWDTSNYKVILNGNTGTPEINQSNSNAPFNTTTTPHITIGATYSNSAPSLVQEWSGKLDEVAIWNTALSATQVQSIYDATSTNLTKDLTTVAGSNLVYWTRMGD